MLKNEERLDDMFIKKILITWRHNSGFSVHNEVRLQAGDAKGIENVAQYIICNTFSLSKLSYIENTGTVIYRSKMSHGDNKPNLQITAPLSSLQQLPSTFPRGWLRLICSHCGGLMKIVSFIYEHRVIKNILDHLGLSEETKSKRERAPPFPQTVETVIELYADGWPEYEEPFIDVQTL